MNPHRSVLFQFQECFRLAGYLVDGERLYSNDEIASQLGASREWVSAILGPNAGLKSPCDLRYDAGDSAIKIIDSFGHLTNMTYDSASFVARPKPEDQGG
jgi:hypothetical protein